MPLLKTVTAQRRRLVGGTAETPWEFEDSTDILFEDSVEVLIYNDEVASGDNLTAQLRTLSVTAHDRYQAGEMFWEFEDAAVIQYENAAFVGHESTASELKATPRTLSGTAQLRPLTLTAEKYNG